MGRQLAESQGETSPNLELQAPERGENKCLLFKLVHVWYFVKVTRAD